MNEIERLKSIDVNGAIAQALREQAERIRGYEYCRGWDKRCGASFCPMCGKRLEVKQND